MLRNTVTDYDRKLAELSYECNRRISSMNAEYDKLAALVQHVLGVNVAANNSLPPSSNSNGATYFINGTNLTTSFLPQQLGAPSGHATQLAVSFPHVTSGTNVVAVQSAPQPAPNTDMLRSLSQAAVSLHNNESESSRPTKKRLATETATKGKKKVSKVKRNDGKKPSKQTIVDDV
jgi:hypothetical protein